MSASSCVLIAIVWLNLAGYLAVLFMAATARLGRTAIREIGLFNCSPALSYCWHKTRFTINWIPIPGSAYLKFYSKRSENDEGEDEPYTEPPISENDRYFSDLHPVFRAVIPISGLVFLILVCGFTLGFSETFESIKMGVEQAFHGAIAPRKSGVELLETAFSTIREQPFHVSFAYAAAKLTAINLLPIPYFNIWLSIAELLKWRRTNKFILPQWSLWLGFLTIIFVYFGWSAALFFYFSRTG